MSLVEEQQLGFRGFLDGGGGCPALLHGLASLSSVNRCPCRRLALLVLEKRLQGKGRRQAPGAHWLLCYYPEREEGGASEQLMAVCDKSVFTYKRAGGWGGPELTTQQRKACALRVRECWDSRKLTLIQWAVATLLCCGVWEQGRSPPSKRP